MLKVTLYFGLFSTPIGTYCVFFWLTRLRMNVWFFPGGLDVDVFSNGLISEELARGCAGIGGTILNNTLGVSKKLNGKSYILKLNFIKHYCWLVISSVEKRFIDVLAEPHLILSSRPLFLSWLFCSISLLLVSLLSSILAKTLILILKFKIVNIFLRPGFYISKSTSSLAYCLIVSTRFVLFRIWLTVYSVSKWSYVFFQLNVTCSAKPCMHIVVLHHVSAFD